VLGSFFGERSRVGGVWIGFIDVCTDPKELKRSSIGPMSRNTFLDLPGSPSVPSLLEWPCNTTAANDQETRSSESESGTSAKAHDMSCFWIPMERKSNLTGHHLHQSQYGSSSSYPDSSDQLSEMQSSYMHNLMLDDPRIHMNMMPTASLSTVSNMRRDHISPILDQQLPGLRPPMPCNPHMPLLSNFSNLGFSTDAYFSGLQSSNAVLKALVAGQSAGSSMEPFSVSGVHHKTLSNNNSIGTNNCVNSFQWADDGFSRKILGQPIQEVDGATCLSTYINDEMTSVVCNRLDPPLDQLDSAAAPPVDFDSMWNIRKHLVISISIYMCIYVSLR
jgi:hypothetical protein